MPVTTTLQRIKFHDLFNKNPDGSLTPKRIINVNGIIFGPGIAFNKGVNFAGADLFQFQAYDIAAEDDNGVLIIKGFYSK